MIARLLSKDVFIPSPAQGVGVVAASYNASENPDVLMSVSQEMSRCDTTEIAYFRYSNDNGQTWSEPSPWLTKFEEPQGTRRRHFKGGYYDTHSDRYLRFWIDGTLPNDEPLEGMKQWKLFYSVSKDGGKTNLVEEQVVHAGENFDEVDYLPGLSVGKSCVMMGDYTQRPITRSDGAILLPIQTGHVDEDGNYYNPGGGYTFHDVMLLIGTWQGDRLSWQASELIVGDPELSARGFYEPAIAELPGGRLIMVMRSSNDVEQTLPGYKWYVTSEDGGMTWAKPVPWTFADGSNFYSPSSCSQLIPYSDGRLFWMGNICEGNPATNNPRYPIVLGQVDKDTGLLIRDSLVAIDDKKPDESPWLTLSNFLVREEPQTGHLLLHLSRLFAKDFRKNNQPDFTADANLYRIELL